ncbi:Alpha/beta hydrolase fold-1 [Dillenia turbinata]|uniref:Alpha/beta hydrolase fold-1 n=1 Tax=Dillenia turbinata TaxID=194707 RepID=A0AAN8ZQ41_9MAGN
MGGVALLRNTISFSGVQDHGILLSQFLGSSRSLETLAFEEVYSHSTSSYDKPDRTAFILHGLLGSGRIWRSFSRNLASTLSDSPSATESLCPPHDMVNAAKDLSNLVYSHGWDWPDVVIGHSMGGKIALQFAESCAHGDYGVSASLPKQLWVLDSVAGEVNKGTKGDVEKVLETLQGLPSSVPSRNNLRKSGEQEKWAFNLEGAVKMFKSYREKSYWSLLEHPPKGLEIAMVHAENSDRWEPDAVERLETHAAREGDESQGKVSLHVLCNAGHWVHVDNPKGLLEIIAPNMMPLN